MGIGNFMYVVGNDDVIFRSLRIVAVCSGSGESRCHHS